MNEYEIGLEDRKTKKRWAGENYGWQSKESYNKLYTQGKLNPVQQQIDRFTSSVSRAVMEAPIAKPLIKTVQSGVRFAFEALPVPAQQAVTKGLETTQTAAENIAAATGLPVSLTDPFTITDVATGGASALASKGLRQAVKTGVKGLADDVLPPPTGLVPAMAGGALVPTPRPQLSFDRGGIVFKATTSPEWTAPGMGQGVATTPKYSETVKGYMKRLPEYADAEAEIERRFAAGEITAKRRASSLGKLKKKVDDLIATFEYDPENPAVYVESSPTKAKRATQVPDPVAEFVTGVPEKAHQHHYLAKAQTRPFIDKLLNLVNNNIADLDDLVNFFTWTEKYSLYSGGVRKNMADLSPRGHISSKSVTEFDRKYNTHKILQELGLEVKSGTAGGAEGFIKKQYNIDAVTNADELMQVWDQFLQEIGVPSRDVAKNLQAFFLAEYRKGLSPDKLRKFNEMAAKLYK